MDTRFIKSLISVIETGSIAAAARKENLTAAAVSQRVKALENTLDCSLLTRSGHSAKPTSECLSILPRLKAVASEVEQISDDLDTSGLSGVLNVGVVSSVLSGLLPRCIQYLAIHTPNLLLKIVPGSSQELYQKLIDRQLDLAIVISPAFKLPKVIQQRTLFSEPLILISHEPFSCVEKALSQQPFVQYDKQSWGGSIAYQYLQDQKLAAKVKTLCEIDSLETIVLMVQQNMGVSLIPCWEGLHTMAPTLQKLEITEYGYHRDISFLSHRQAGKDKLLAAFEQAITQSILLIE